MAKSPDEIMYKFLVEELRRIMNNWNGEHSIEAIRFLLDMDPLGEEWLPEPAPLGSFPHDADATPLEDLERKVRW